MRLNVVLCAGAAQTKYEKQDGEDNSDVAKKKTSGVS